jgi:predicted heme/steroid binding protein
MSEELTLEELSKYDGTNGTTYICATGRIYDVTTSGFYGKGESYNIFAGVESCIVRNNHN